MIAPRRALAFAATIALAATSLVACGESTGSGGGLDPGDAGERSEVGPGETGVADAGGTDGSSLDGGAPDATGDADAAGDAGPDRRTEDYPLAACDELVPSRCALPWPSNLYLAPDDERRTDYQLRFEAESLPNVSGGAHPDPAPYRHRDGFGLGTPILTHFPDVDTSSMAGRYDVAPSVDDDAKIVLLEVGDDGSTERVPYWAELDQRATEADEQQLLIVRPAVILKENTRYVVAFRDLETRGGEPIEASESFRKLRDGEVEPGSVLSERQARFEEVFGLLDEAGVGRESLTLAWDFHTASGEGLRDDMLTMRSKALEATGEEGPTLEYDPEDLEEFSEEDNPRIGLEIDGTFEVPHFMESVGDDREWITHRDEEGVVVQNGTREANFLMRVPQTALDGEQVGVVLYGHGLLGSRDGIDRELWGELAEDNHYILIAADWTGMAEEDRSTAVAGTSDISNFQGVADRMHQGILEFLLLARTARHRLAGLEALTERGVDVDSEEVFYVGASQGGIYGQTVMALTNQIERGFLAVPGNNYSTLLHRSVAFDLFLSLMDQAYPAPADRLICIAAMQQLWDGTDPVSYAGHIEREPLVADAPDDKDVLLALSKGDYQVEVATNEVLARSEVGIPLMENYDDTHQPWGAPSAEYPHDESGIILFDYGNPWPMRGNRPPMDDLDDPHDHLEQVDQAGELIDTFFRDEEIVDICGGEPCDF